MTTRNGKKFDAMTDAQKLEYMATANRVTVKIIWQLIDNKLRPFYAAKVRGIVVSDLDGNWQYNTADEARIAGWNILNHWKREYYAEGGDA